MASGTNYLQKEESFMYDREKRFPMEETRNQARIEYTEKGVLHMASRRCEVLAISLSGAVLGIVTQFHIPPQFCLEIPEARIAKVGCVVMRINTNNTIEVRFLRMMAERELNRVFVFSTHPAHRDRVMDLRSW
ncbi:hypothetical protein PZ897_18330 [Hoeflea sp. YIM 152468]|uniref:hypothetical protein n=1 Tax=Hoeflea sp. YIM 152468 TaxID=3031759 RepID=UPI0023DA71B2|nr:hypothetical protein [Hoeflea sp. YIM 152468]MDF1610144.1 hypothetical protein [Hoeflea sp. YIM 152468]